MSAIRIDFIIPFLKFEEINLNKLKHFHTELSTNTDINISWILVQDSGVSPEQLETIHQQLHDLNIPIQFTSHQKNLGKGAAIQTGTKLSHGDYFLFTDADLTYPVSTILEFFEKIPHYDIVIGQRDHKNEKNKRSLKRKILSSVMSTMNHYCWALPVRDTQCGLKMFKSSMKELIQSIKCKRYLFDWELLMRGEQKQIHVGVVPVSTDNHEDSSISNKTLGKEIVGIGKNFAFPLVTFSFISILMTLLIYTSLYHIPGDQFAIRGYISSDFNSHIHQIFHMMNVDSWPNEYPLHCGEENRYHFFYYYLVSLGAKLGINFASVINAFSAASWIGAIFLLMYWAWLLTGSWFVVTATPLLFYFNSSLNFINILDFSNLPTLKVFLIELWNKNDFLAFGPWGKGDIAAFWSLHVFLNQRHFIFGLFLLALATLVFTQRNRKNSHKFILVTFVVPMLYLCHRPSLMALCIIMMTQFLFPPFAKDKTRKVHLQIGLYSLAMLFLLHLISPSPIIQSPFLKWGYLWGYLQPRPWYDFFLYWFKNLGVYLPFFFIGLFCLKKFSFKLILPSLILAAVALNIQFAREMAGNHKFFNIFVYFTIPVTLLGVQLFYKKVFFLPLIKQLFIFLAIFSLCIGGLCDQLNLWRGPHMIVPSVEEKSVVEFLKSQPDKGCVMTNGLYYNPSIWSGHPVYMAWPYFSWGLGYPTPERTNRLNAVLTNPNKKSICQFASMENLHWLVIEKIDTDQGVLPPANPMNMAKILKPAFMSPNFAYSVTNLIEECRTP